MERNRRDSRYSYCICHERYVKELRSGQPPFDQRFEPRTSEIRSSNAAYRTTLEEVTVKCLKSLDHDTYQLKEEKAKHILEHCIEFSSTSQKTSPVSLMNTNLLPVFSLRTAKKLVNTMCSQNLEIRGMLQNIMCFNSDILINDHKDFELLLNTRMQ